MTFMDRGEAHLRRKLGVTDAGEGGDRAVRERTRLRPYAVVDLHPGELLMLPASWYHRVECLTEEPCQSVSIFWPNPNSIACSQKIGHFFPHIMSDTPAGFCNAPEVYNRTVSTPQPPELDSLKAARDACGGATPKDGGGASRAPAACLGALADWHYLLLAMAAAHLRHFPPLLALHPELEAGGTDLERARLFVQMVHRSQYAAHTMDQLRELRMPFACDRGPGGGEAAPGSADDENKSSQCSRYMSAKDQLRARTRVRLRSDLNSIPLFQNLKPKASQTRASRALHILYTYLSLVSQNQSQYIIAVFK